MTGPAAARQTAPVNHPLVDDQRLAAWMDEQGLATGAPIVVTRITTGHSNEVFRVERGDFVAVLRRPPRTPLSPTAHDMAREFRVLRALRDPAGWHGRAPVPVPEPIACCTDGDVIGAPFYLMHLVDGVVVRESLPAVLAPAPAVARDCAYALIDAVVVLDPSNRGIDVTGTPGDPIGHPCDAWKCAAVVADDAVVAAEMIC